MNRFRKAVIALFAGTAMITLSSPLMTHAVQATVVPAASVQVVNEKMSGIVPYAIVGRQYRAQLKISGGTAPYRWHIVSGSAPLGLSFNSNTGLLSGIPTRAGDWNFNIWATDANGVVSSATFTVSILLANERVISVNGFSRPVSVLIRKDPVHKDMTTYISLLDLQGTLGVFGIDAYWNAKKGLTLASSDTFTVTGSTTTKNPFPIFMTGSKGTWKIGSYSSFVKSAGDTYLPLYNVMEALRYVQGLEQTWDGTTWSITNGLGSQASNSGDTSSIWYWTGRWTDDSAPSQPSMDITNVTAKSFDFDFRNGPGVNLTGSTATLSGNTATYTDKTGFSIVFTKVSPTEFILEVHGGSISGIQGVYHLEPLQAILSVSNGVATVTGRSSYPVGTPVNVLVEPVGPGGWHISWSTTVQKGGLIQTSHSISSLLGNVPQTIQAWLWSNGPKDATEVSGTITNTVTTKYVQGRGQTSGETTGRITSPNWNWTGTWIDDSTANLRSIDITNATDKSFDFNFSGATQIYLTGNTATLSGNTATYTDKLKGLSIVFTKISPTEFTIVVHGGSIPEIQGVYHLEPLQAILSESNNVATLTGRSSLPVGTPVDVLLWPTAPKANAWQISWSTMVQKGGLIQTSHSISSLLGKVPQTIQAQLLASGPIVGYGSVTNTVTAAVYH